MMKTIVIYTICSLIVLGGYTQSYYGSFTVGGIASNYYPVLFSVSGVDGNSSLGKLSVYIDNVHSNGVWSGAFHSEIDFISTNWGHIPTKIFNFTYFLGNGNPYNDPIGDLIDGSTAGGGSQLVLWLKGGATYQWSTTLNSRSSVIDANTSGTSKVSASGNTLNIITSQSQIILNSKNNSYFPSSGIGTPNGGYFGGNVGIGTSSPTERLCVNGNIKTKKLIVTQTGWADYVFKPTYKLKSLTEVEQYIKEHQHLPDVPSQKEVEENGVDIGGTQVIFLKKIEELTLYIIESDKTLKKVLQENKSLKKRIKKLEIRNN